MVEYLLALALITADYSVPEQIADLEKQARVDTHNIEARLKLARIFIEQENYPEAEKNLREAEGIDSLSGMVQYLWGRYYDQQDNIAAAFDRYSKAVAFDSTLSDGWRNLAYIDEITGNYQSMLERFEKALVNSKDSAGLLYDIGVTYDYLEIADSAIIAYHRALAVGAKFPEIYINLGADWGILEDIDSAQYYLEKAVKAGSQSPELFYNLGMLASERGKREEAIEHYMECLSLDQAYSPAKLQLGNLYESLGDSANALIYFQDFVKTAPFIYRDDIKSTKEKLVKYESRQ
jgi:tetratricopeptide (TPR) repeat protein